jgi:hypothetical protein
MGAVLGSSSDFWESEVLMGANDEIDFRFEQLDYIEQAKAWGRAEAFQQAGVGGMGGAGLQPNDYALNYGFWSGLNAAMNGLGYLFIPVGLIGSVLGFILNFPPALVFAFLWMFFTFFSHHLLYHSYWGQRWRAYARIPSWTILGGLVVSLIIAFAVYNLAIYEKDLSKTAKIAIGSGGGLLTLLIIMFFGIGLFRQQPIAAPLIQARGPGIAQVAPGAPLLAA